MEFVLLQSLDCFSSYSHSYMLVEAWGHTPASSIGSHCVKRSGCSENIETRAVVFIPCRWKRGIGSWILDFKMGSCSLKNVAYNEDKAPWTNWQTKTCKQICLMKGNGKTIYLWTAYTPKYFPSNTTLELWIKGFHLFVVAYFINLYSVQ